MVARLRWAGAHKVCVGYTGKLEVEVTNGKKTALDVGLLYYWSTGRYEA